MVTASLPADDSATEVQATVAYFSMEVGLQDSIPTYSGGLGVLAGDTLRSAADVSLPLVAVSLLHRKGYFRQKLDERGNQTEEQLEWPVSETLAELSPRVSVEIEHRSVNLRAWRYDVRGISGHIVPVLLLDADLPANAPEDRRLTDHLYGGDTRYRLCQEVILGIGGVRMLRALGYRNLRRFHMARKRLAARPFRPSSRCACSRRIRRWPPGTTSSRWTWSRASSQATTMRSTSARGSFA
jgi:starch phosphorylase